jgi:ribose transport system substrate-binding protein
VAGSGSSAAGQANVAAASAAIEQFVGHPSAFPAATPLRGSLPSGTTFVYLDEGGQSASLFAQLMSDATKVLGVQLKVINSGTTASTSQAAAESALALKPAAVLLLGNAPAMFGDTLQSLSDAGVKVISLGLSGSYKQYGITFNYLNAIAEEHAGRLMADWVIAHKGAGANVAFYGIPEVTYTPVMESAFKSELSKNCSSCTVRFVSIDLADIGTTAPQTVVTDLQSHPSTNYAVFELAEIAQGLPAAMKSAGLSIPDIGYNPDPLELQYVKTGEMAAAVTSDLVLETWTTVDLAARLVLNQQPTPAETIGDSISTILTQKDTFNPEDGWVAYPDFANRFAKLWHPAS